MARLYGKGTITELEKGKKYRIRFSAGKDPETGKYRQVKETFIGTKRGAELRVEQIRARYERLDELREYGLDFGEMERYGLMVDRVVSDGMTPRQVADELDRLKVEESRSVTFAEWCERYMSTREELGKCRPSTLARDRTLSKHLLRRLGDVKLVDFTPAIANELYASMRRDGVGDTTIRQCHRLLKAVMKQAVYNDLIVRNPIDRVEAPRNPKPERQSLGVEESRKLAGICSSGAPTAYKTAVYMALATGARLGEIMGLEWQHVALGEDRPFAYFVQQFNATGELSPLKTDKDDNPVGRVVPLDGSTVDVLKAWRAVQREQLNALGVEQGADTPVVSNSLGGHTNHSCFERWWRGFCVENGFSRMVAEDGRTIVELSLGDDPSLYDEKEYLLTWRDSEGWPCDADGKRYSRSYPRPKVKATYCGLHFHALRHTHFSLRLAEGMDIPTAQALGGWSTPAMLMNVYAHPIPENIWASAGFMDGLTVEEARC